MTIPADRMGRYIQLGTLERMYQNILTMLLRLRQLTAHMFLVQEQIKTELDIMDINEISDSLSPEARSNLGQAEILTQLKNLVLGVRPNTYQGHSVDFPDDMELVGSGDNADGLAQKFAKFLRLLKNKKNWEELK